MDAGLRASWIDNNQDEDRLVRTAPFHDEKILRIGGVLRRDRRAGHVFGAVNWRVQVSRPAKANQVPSQPTPHGSAAFRSSTAWTFRPLPPGQSNHSRRSISAFFCTPATIYAFKAIICAMQCTDSGNNEVEENVPD
jgi:hypothetical protein